MYLIILVVKNIYYKVLDSGRREYSQIQSVKVPLSICFCKQQDCHDPVGQGCLVRAFSQNTQELQYIQLVL